MAKKTKKVVEEVVAPVVVEPKLFTIVEASNELGCTPQTFRSWTLKLDLAPEGAKGRALLYGESTVNAVKAKLKKNRSE